MNNNYTKKLYENLSEQGVVFLKGRSRGFLPFKKTSQREESSSKNLYFGSVETFKKGFE
jgi:hypothetical protein